MKELSKEEKLKRSNIALALILGVIAALGTLIPYYYFTGPMAGGG